MAWVLGKRSRAELDGVHPDLIKVVELALSRCPVDFAVHDGIRVFADQQALVKAKASWTMASRHLAGEDGYGHAADLVPYINGKLRWEWEPIYEIADSMRGAAIDLDVPIRWGGVWDRQLQKLTGSLNNEVQEYGARRRAKFPGKSIKLDGPHFELPKSKLYP